MAENYVPMIVALLDKPSPESFGMTGLIIKVDESEAYQTRGLASGITIVEAYQFRNRLGGHILKVQAPLPTYLSNPVALWLGTQFQVNATALNAPPLPVIDEYWHTPLEPYERTGKYTLKESSEAYRLLEGWVETAAREAFVRNSYELAILTRWALPVHAATQAALYYTAPTTTQREAELGWQLQIEPKVSIIDLMEKHIGTKSLLLEGQRK